VAGARLGLARLGFLGTRGPGLEETLELQTVLLELRLDRIQIQRSYFVSC